MAHDEHHVHLVKEVAEMLELILSKSPQAIYIYLDDTHKICNQKFADMLGYGSIDEWVANQTPVDDVLKSDQDKVIKAYGAASEQYEASSLSVTMVKKDGEKAQANVIMVPFTYRGEVFAIHFISEK